MLLLLTEPRDTDQIHAIKCKDDFSYYQYFWLSWVILQRVELNVTVQSYLTLYFMLHCKPNCLLFVLDYHRAHSFTLINLPLALSSLSSPFAYVHNRNHFPTERAQQWREGLSILWAQLKGCTEVAPDSKFQLSNKWVSGGLWEPLCRGGVSPGLCHSAAAAPWDAPFPMAALQASTCFTWDSSSLWDICQNSAKFSLEREKPFLEISFKAKHSEA